MSATAVSATVEVDRQLLIDLIVECHTVEDILGAFAGCTPTAVTEDLTRLAERLAEVVVGPVVSDASSGESVGPRRELWDAASSEARGWFASYGNE